MDSQIWGYPLLAKHRFWLPKVEPQKLGNSSALFVSFSFLSVRTGFYKILDNVHLEWRDELHVPNAVGWELNRGKKVYRCISLAKSMDPTMYVI